MNPETQADIQVHAVSEYPRECCGLVVVVRGRERYVPCRNVAATPAEHFALDPRDYAAASDAGQITAIVHSHPDAPARPSEADLVQCEASELPWVIVSVMPGENGPEVAETRFVEPSGYQAPLVGRTWSHGLLDCWGLCRDWYAREWGLILPDPPRADGWWNDGATSLYNDAALRDANFVPVSASEIAKGDLVLMQIRSGNRVPNHAGIYLGDGQMLHHLHGRLSSRDNYGGYYAEMTRSIWRHRAAPETT
ncbi:C40 family peptidase [Luteibacter yeojuensis]|uniref:Peptidase P60 n=1 Tax=Luteibacter yeojuensis TaxID=345309 RepID=A0A7X5TP71_9GAMM|nr:C40 family peptidase [Luteibacter yeojuensis]NID14404.1 peptidase P60 [Luteibacter yeojuensis]